VVFVLGFLIPSLDHEKNQRCVFLLPEKGFAMRSACLNPLAIVMVTFLSSHWILGQTLKTRPAERQHPADPVQILTSAPLLTVPMSVSAGTPIKVALDSQVRIREVGQVVHGKTTDPVYAFDKLLIPAGTVVNGKIAAIDGVPKMVRVQNALNANFSPLRTVHLQFDELLMADGRHVPIKTVASPAPNEILQFVSANEKGEKKRPKETASSEVSEAQHEIKRQLNKQVKQRWNTLKGQIREPVKSAKNYVIAQSPVHRQYLYAGTSFNADLLQPLDFGTEAVKPETLTSVGAPPPSGSVVHARLVTALDSATTKKGAPVEAVITEPLVVADHLILPEGSVVKGSVVQVQPARRMSRNGQLRILFHEVAPPNGIEQKVEASLEAVAVAKGTHLKLDAEGGAQVTTPRTRYLTTGIAVALAAGGGSGDRDAGAAGRSVGETGKGAAQGASGFRLVGMVLTLTARSAAFSATMGVYGAASSVYYHFLARGRDVVYPKDMAMIIGLGTRDSKPKQQASTGSGTSPDSATLR
jgi:hypothetical protein